MFYWNKTGGISIMKLYDSELKVMEVLWDRGEASAKTIAQVLAEQVGWSKTTTYTVIKKCLDKGAATRTEPGFVCRPLVSRAEAQAYATDELVDKRYGGAADRLVASLLGRKRLTEEELDGLKKLVEELK